MQTIAMTPRSVAVPARTAMVCWLLVFPGHFIYQTAVQRGLIPSVLGGYYTASIAASLVLLAPSFLRIALGRQANGSPPVVGYLRVGSAFWAFLALFALATSIGSASGADPEITNPLYAYVVKFAGLYILAMLTPWDDRTFVAVARLVQLLLFALLVGNASEGAYLINQLVPLNEEDQLDYHGLALGFSVVSLAAAYATGPVLFRWLQWLLALAGLFLIGARSEFVGLAFAIVLIEVARRKTHWDYIAAASLPLAFILAFIALPDLGDFDHRVLGLVDLASDQSAIERREMSAWAWSTVRDNPLLGSFASYRPGEYAHNILSAWVDLGVLGFALLLLMLLGPVLSILAVIMSNDSSLDDFYALVLGCLGMCLLLLLFAKTYFYQLIPIAVGIYARTAMRHALRSTGGRA